MLRSIPKKKRAKSKQQRYDPDFVEFPSFLTHKNVLVERLSPPMKGSSTYKLKA